MSRVRCECLYCGNVWMQSPILWGPDTEVCSVCKESQNIKVRKEAQRGDVFGYGKDEPKRKVRNDFFED